MSGPQSQLLNHGRMHEVICQEGTGSWELEKVRAQNRVRAELVHSWLLMLHSRSCLFFSLWGEAATFTLLKGAGKQGSSLLWVPGMDSGTHGCRSVSPHFAPFLHRIQGRSLPVPHPATHCQAHTSPPRPPHVLARNQHQTQGGRGGDSQAGADRWQCKGMAYRGCPPANLVLWDLWDLGDWASTQSGQKILLL